MTTAERLNLLHRVASADAFPMRVEPILAEPAPTTTDMQAAIKTGVADLVELILKRRDRLEQLIREPSLQSLLLPKFLAISLVGFVFFGVALSLVLPRPGIGHDSPRFVTSWPAKPVPLPALTRLPAVSRG